MLSSREEMFTGSSTHTLYTGTRISCLFILYIYICVLLSTYCYDRIPVTLYTARCRYLPTGLNLAGVESRQQPSTRRRTPVGYQLINDVYTVNRLLPARRPTAVRMPIIPRFHPVRDIIIITIFKQ